MRDTLGRRVAVAVGAVGLGLGMAACSSFRDALVVNPCRDRAVVSLSSDSESSARPEDSGVAWGEEHSVAPYSSLLIPDVFEGEGPYSARIAFEATGSVSGLSVPRSERDPVTVIIPADECPHLQG